MSGRIFLLGMVLLAGCDSTVHIRLVPAPSMVQDCDRSIINMRSFYAELMREGDDPQLILKKCIELPPGPNLPGDLGDLESMLSSRIVFQDVPSDGSWTIWVEGFATESCRKAANAPLLCGAEKGISLGGEIVINVSCGEKFVTTGICRIL